MANVKTSKPKDMGKKAVKVSPVNPMINRQNVHPVIKLQKALGNKATALYLMKKMEASKPNIDSNQKKKASMHVIQPTDQQKIIPPESDGTISEQPTSSNPNTSVDMSLDLIIKPDSSGFELPELDHLYNEYRKSKKKGVAASPREWAMLQRSGKPRIILEGLLGPDFAKSGSHGKDRIVNIDRFNRRKDYTQDNLEKDMQTILKDRKLFDRLGNLLRKGTKPGQIKQSYLNILKGNIAEILAGDIKQNILQETSGQHPNAQLFENVKVRIPEEDNRLGDPKLFSDGLVGSIVGDVLYVFDIVEVKSGPSGGQEATSQHHKTLEKNLVDGMVVIITTPDGKKHEFPYHDKKGRVKVAGLGYGGAKRHIISPRGTENLGTDSADQVGNIYRHALHQTPEDINYLARLVIENLDMYRKLLGYTAPQLPEKSTGSKQSNIIKRSDMSIELLQKMRENKDARITPPVLSSFEELKSPEVIRQIKEKSNNFFIVGRKLFQITDTNQGILLKEINPMLLASILEPGKLPSGSASEHNLLPSGSGSAHNLPHPTMAPTPGKAEKVYMAEGGRKTGPFTGVIEEYVVIEGKWYIFELPVYGGEVVDLATGKVAFEYEKGRLAGEPCIKPVIENGKQLEIKAPVHGPTPQEAAQMTKGLLVPHENARAGAEGALMAIYQRQFSYTQEKEFEKAKKDMEKFRPQIDRYLALGEEVYVYAVMNAPKAVNIGKSINPEVTDLETYKHIYIAHGIPGRTEGPRLEQGSANSREIERLPESRDYRSYLLQVFKPEDSSEFAKRYRDSKNSIMTCLPMSGEYRSENSTHILYLDFSGNKLEKLELVDTSLWMSYTNMDITWDVKLGVIKAILLSPTGNEIIQSIIFSGKDSLIETCTVTTKEKNEEKKIIWKRK